MKQLYFAPEVRKVSAAGVGIFATCMGAEEAEKSVIFLAPFPMDSWTWRTILPRFAAENFRAIALDLRGFGGSDKLPEEPDLLRLATDIQGAIRSLGCADVHVVGVGLGGLVAWSLAHSRMERLQSVISVNAPHPLLGVHPRLRLLTWRKLQDPQFIWDTILNSAADRLCLYRAATRYATVFTRSICAKAAAGTWQAAVNPSRATKKILASRTRVPVISVRCLRHPQFGNRAELFAAGQNYALNHRVVEFPGAGIYPQEELPDEFAQFLLDLLPAA